MNHPITNYLPYDLIVFDWDGTLLDSVASIVACMRRAADDVGITSVSDEAVRGTIGLGLADAAALLGRDEPPENVEAVLAAYRKHWFATYRDQPRAFAGAAEVLEELGRAGYLLAIATGKSRRGLDHDLKATGLGSYFQATRTVDEACSKPHPQMLLDLLDELGVRAGRALMVGDTTHDLRMAAGAGTDAVAVTCGSHRTRDLEELCPAGCLADVTALRPWLEERRRAGRPGTARMSTARAGTATMGTPEMDTERNGG